MTARHQPNRDDDDALVMLGLAILMAGAQPSALLQQVRGLSPLLLIAKLQNPPPKGQLHG